ncbi:MAG: hypothetical protein MUC36_23130 [Planctomycetes bacterium]|nr:hypothetical protein [Planctomycetota bacterium]
MRLLAASSLLLAAPAFAQQFAELPGNNTSSTAQTFPIGQQCNANLAAGSEDWFTFTTPGGYHLINTFGGETASTDTTLTLYNASVTPLGYNDDAVSVVSAINLDLPAGTYLVRVKGFSATSAGNYTLDISLPFAKPYTGTEVEPNDSIATANPVVNGSQISASLTPPVSLVATAVPAATVVLTGAVASSTATVITPVVPPVVGAYNGAGYFVRFTSGANAGLSRRLTTGTATTLTTESWGASIPLAGDTFEIVTSSPTVLADVAAVGSTTTTLNATAALVSGAYIAPTGSHAVRFLTGANAGLSRTITGNTATTITTAAWLAAPAAGDSFIVVAGGTANAVVPTAPIVAGQFNDQRHWVRCTSGTNVGLSRAIGSNTGTYLSLLSSFPNAPAPGDTFEIDQYDSDTYRFDVTAPKAQVVFSITEGTAPWVAGWSYEVLDAAGVRVLAPLGTGLADSPTAAPENRVSSFRVWPTGTYYVRVFQRRTTLTGDDNLVPFGNYRFEAKILDIGSLGTVAETEAAGGPQSNNTAATAVAITPGQLGVGNITISTGADPTDLWGPITVTQQTLLAYQVSQGATATPLSDATILLRQLLDPATGLLTAGTSTTGGNTLESGSLNPRAAFNLLLPDTTYYLEVVSPGTTAAQSGDYVLEIATLDAPTYSAGNWVTVGANASGCGTPGVPTINRVTGSPAATTYGEQPLIGQTLVTRISNLNGLGNFGLLVIGFSGISGPSGAPAGTPQSVYNPQPLDLTIFGAPGCSLLVNPTIVELLIADPAGNVDYTLQCPGNASLAGSTLFFQPCKWDFSISALGIQPGNWARAIFGRRQF